MGNPSIPEQMLACQVTEVWWKILSLSRVNHFAYLTNTFGQFNKPYTIHNVPTPKDLGPYDLLVKVAVASLCHTDGMVSAGVFGTKLPCTASHEGAGTVASVGSSVQGFSLGDRIMCGIFRNMCGVCSDCQGPENYSQYCPNNEGGIGVHIDGAFADYVIVDSRMACKLPDKVSFTTAAPLACAGCTIFRGVLQANLVQGSGEWLAIVGSGGGLGHLGIQFAKALGLNVIGIDARDEGLELSKATGADIVIDARIGNEKVVEQVKKVTGGNGADATVNVSDAKSAAATACAVTKMHGLMVQIAQVGVLWSRVQTCCLTNRFPHSQTLLTFPLPS